VFAGVAVVVELVCGHCLWWLVMTNSNRKKSGYPLEELFHRPLHLQHYSKLLPSLQQQYALIDPTSPFELTQHDLSKISYIVQYLMEVRLRHFPASCFF
jgi:hypothetical protein